MILYIYIMKLIEECVGKIGIDILGCHSIVAEDAGLLGCDSVSLLDP
jgi:hypothetical protein